MALYDVSVKAAIIEHAAFQVYTVSFLKGAEIGALQCFLNGYNGVLPLPCFYYGKAYAIVGYALVYLERIADGTAEPVKGVGAGALNSYYFCGRFYDACEHGAKLRYARNVGNMIHGRRW